MNLKEDIIDNTSDLYKALSDIDKEIANLKIKMEGLSRLSAAISNGVLNGKITTMEELYEILSLMNRSNENLLRIYLKF